MSVNISFDINHIKYVWIDVEKRNIKLIGT